MGNQLSGSVPFMIIPVERYFNMPELGDFDFMGNLGSTRFLKIAKAMHKSISSNTHPSRSNTHPGKSENLAAVEIFRDGLCLLKIFVVNDQSLALAPYINQIEEIDRKLSNELAYNCLPFKKTILTDKTAVLIRQFGKDTLYDRLSTRPFLKDVEKRWIAFQLLQALEQCQNAKVCHGDIKSQNVLIASWNWVFLADFASFKPTILPADNPADFSYFFDTGRRRTCYIAPERFVKSSELANFTLLPGEQAAAYGCTLDYSMDVFSVGCVLVELFTDGLSPFDFSQMLAYVEKRYYPSKALDSIRDSKIREMITGMIQLDPRKRCSAGQILSRYRRTVFSDEFYTFLYPYMRQFVELPRLSHEEKIDRIQQDVKLINKHLKPDVEILPFYVIFISVVTSLIRCLIYSDSKLKALRLLRFFSTFSKEDVILDRILPYVLYTCQDSDPRIRAESVHCISQILASVKEVPKSDVRVFVDYIFPALNGLILDPCCIVKTALAEEMALLADTAARFLEYVNLNSEADPQVQADCDSYANLNYQTELKSLQEIVQEMVVTLLCDKDNNIRRTLIHSGLPRLCLFFGRQKASDVLMSHLITFLNDKSDWRLRASFFDCIPALAAYVGWQSTSLLKPLLIQGFKDHEEHVVFKTLESLTNLCRLGLLQKPAIIELFHDVVPFLAHPNLLLRIGTASFVSSCAKSLNLADLHCKLMPTLLPYMKKQLMKLDREGLLLHWLTDPLPRSVWNNAKNSPLMPDLLNFLQEKSLLQQLGQPVRMVDAHSSPSIKQPTALPEHPQVRHFYERLRACGLNEVNEFKLQNFGEILCKLRLANSSSTGLSFVKHTAINDALPIGKRGLGHASQPQILVPSRTVGRSATVEPGTVDLSFSKIRRKHADLTVDRVGKRVYCSKGVRSPQAMNREWNEMFGTQEKPTNEILSPDQSPASDVTPEKLETFDENLATKTIIGSEGQQISVAELFVEVTVSQASEVAVSQASLSLLSDEVNFYPQEVSQGPIDTSIAAETKIRMAPCRSDLASLVEIKRDEWKLAAKWACNDFTSDLFFNEKSVPPDNSTQQPIFWRPNGQLLAHLHEHRGCVKRLSAHPSGKFFASCGWDGTVKFWDVAKFEGHSMVNKSKFTYNKCGGRLTSVSCTSDSFSCSSDNGQLQIVKFNLGSSKPKLIYQTQVDQENDGHLIDTCAFDDFGRISVVGLAHHGRVICWDAREPPGRPAWRLTNPSPLGLVTCMALDPGRRHWVALGTDAGQLALWDVRFRLLMTTCTHPAGVPFCRLQCHPTNPARVWSSSLGSGESTEWNLETSSRQSIVWSHQSPPLSYNFQDSSNENHVTASAILPYPNFEDPATSMLIIGDNSGNIFNWDLNSVKNSYTISSACDLDPILDGALCRSQIIDGVQVFFHQKPSNPAITASHTVETASELASVRCSGQLKVTQGHVDSVTDLLACRSSNGRFLLVSSSRDGVIKAWR